MGKCGWLHNLHVALVALLRGVNVGGHRTFRPSILTRDLGDYDVVNVKANGEDIKTIQELLRHANYKVTADTYTQAVIPTKRAAQSKLVKMILPARAKTGAS